MHARTKSPCINKDSKKLNAKKKNITFERLSLPPAEQKRVIVPVPVSLKEKKEGGGLRESYSHVITLKSGGKVFLSLSVNFSKIETPFCRVVVSDCCAPGPFPDGLTQRGEKCIQGESSFILM